MDYRRRMESFSGDYEEILLEPDLAEEEKKMVLVTHDESTSYANDGKQVLWLRVGETVLRNKSTGQSIMVSEFQCACHRTMRLGTRIFRVLFYAGSGRDGW